MTGHTTPNLSSEQSESSVSRDRKNQPNVGLNGGKPLPNTERSFFESFFDRNLENVRIHTEPDANEAAHSLNAQAFTTGNDIVFQKTTIKLERETRENCWRTN